MRISQQRFFTYNIQLKCKVGINKNVILTKVIPFIIFFATLSRHLNFSRFRGLTDESEIIKFLQHGTLVGLLPVPHPILIRKYQVC